MIPFSQQNDTPLSVSLRLKRPSLYTGVRCYFGHTSPIHSQRSVCSVWGSVRWLIMWWYDPAGVLQQLQYIKPYCVYCSVSGHEFPFSIQMSHVRHSGSQGGGRDTAAAANADKQKAMQVEQLQVYKQCQFILKPRPTETLQQHISAGEIILCVQM